MDIIFLPVNQAYCLIMGKGDHTQIISVDGQSLWENRKDLLSALGHKTMKEFRHSLERTE